MTMGNYTLLAGNEHDPTLLTIKLYFQFTLQSVSHQLALVVALAAVNPSCLARPFGVNKSTIFAGAGAARRDPLCALFCSTPRPFLTL